MGVFDRGGDGPCGGGVSHRRREEGGDAGGGGCSVGLCRGDCVMELHVQKEGGFKVLEENS